MSNQTCIYLCYNFNKYIGGSDIMTLELLAEFDPLLSEHINRCSSNIGSKTSYLSFQTYKEFVQIMKYTRLQNILCAILHKNNLTDVYPNVNTALRIFFMYICY